MQPNLYMDESGSYYIGEPRYRFFLIAAVIIDSKERDLASLLMNKWRQKYLIDSTTSFHAADFFENYQQNNKPELVMPQNFSKACHGLLEIFEHINFEAAAYYIDLQELRKKKNIPDPPLKPTSYDTTALKTYEKNKLNYKTKLKSSLGDIINLPIYLTSNAIFKQHQSILLKDPQCPLQASINVESQSDSDAIVIKALHKFIKTEAGHQYQYGKVITGINFHTKGSLEVGVELADLVAYISTQTLRHKYKRSDEINNLTKLNTFKTLKIREIRTALRNKHYVKNIPVN